MRIDSLVVRVSLTHKAVAETEVRHQPTMEFLLPSATSEAASFPEQTDDQASSEVFHTNGEQIPPPNPLAIADRVYALMKEEARIGRIRGEDVLGNPWPY